MNRVSLSAEFAGANLGDVRRTARLCAMLVGLARRPSGKVSEVFRQPASRQAAYDFLEHETVTPAALQTAASQATAKRCRSYKTVLVALDGSSFSLTDETGAKGFGSIGTHSAGARGLKMLNALAITEDGQTIGSLAQRFWVRQRPAVSGYRPLKERESYRWHEAFDLSLQALRKRAPKTRVHVLADREGDASKLMQHLLASGADFTIRANGTRKVLAGGRRVLVRPQLKKLPPIAHHTVEVGGNDGQPRRRARLELRAAKVDLVLRDHYVGERRATPMTVVWAREVNAPRGAKPVEWLLYTTVPVPDAKAAVQTLIRYTYRWRIEDFHRMLKSGGGWVEDSQLRSPEAVIKWATLHAIVASRAQQLRDVARTNPEAQASSELTDAEIEALVLLKTQEQRYNESVTADGLTVVRAVRWLADLGGFTATGASKKPPGAIVVRRGLERVLETVELLQFLRASGKMR